MQVNEEATVLSPMAAKPELRMTYEAPTPTLGDLSRLVARLVDKKFPPDTPVIGYEDAAGVMHVSIVFRENF